MSKRKKKTAEGKKGIGWKLADGQVFCFCVTSSENNDSECCQQSQVRGKKKRTNSDQKGVRQDFHSVDPELNLPLLMDVCKEAETLGGFLSGRGRWGWACVCLV